MTHLPDSESEYCRVFEETSLLSHTYPCAILDKQFLSQFSSVPKVKRDRENAFKNWYPAVNSYYQYSEDVDSESRVNHLLNHPPRKFHRDKSHINLHYSLRQAQIEYLQTAPVNFLILGKPDLGQQELGRQLAEFWKCIYIDAITLLNDEINSESRAGICIEYNLRCGRAINSTIILRLLGEKVKTPECQHRGFVLCDFPLVANDLFEDDPVSTESAIFNAREIFDELFELVIGDGILSRPNTSIVQSELSMDFSSCNIEPVVVPQPIPIAEPVFVNSLEEQLHFVFDLFEKPFVFIYISCPNVEVVRIRERYVYNVDLEQFFNYQNCLDFMWNRTVRVPNHFPAQIRTQLANYHEIATEFIEQYVLEQNEYFLKLDGRYTIDKLLYAIQLRLSILPVQKVIVPEPFTDENHLVEDQNEVLVTVTNYLEDFKHLSKQKIVNRQFRWHLSDWGGICPVSMKNGINQMGTLPVQFLDQIFFISDVESQMKFIQNPRPYLLPPYPKSEYKIYIFGPPKCAKRLVAQCLSILLQLVVFHPDNMYTSYLRERHKAQIAKYRQEALMEGIQELNKLRKREADEKNRARQKGIDDWLFNSRLILGDLLTILEADQALKHKGDFSPFPFKINRRFTGTSEIELGLAKQMELLQKHNLPEPKTVSYCKKLLTRDDLLLPYLPTHLNIEESHPEPATVNDRFVLNYAEKVLDNIPMEQVEVNEDTLLDIYVNVVGKLKTNWIISEMLMNLNLLQNLPDDLLANDIIVLDDRTPFDEERQKQYFHEHDFDFKQFFEHINCPDIASRCPTDISLSDKSLFAKHIMHEVILESIPSEGVFDVVQHEDEAVKFINDWQPYEEFFSGKNKNVLKIDLTGRPITEVFCEIINYMLDRHRRLASVLTTEDRSEDIQDFLLLHQDSLGEGGGSLEDFDRFRRYGNTLYYCPVTLYKYGVLWRGREDYAANFQDKIYLLSSKDDLDLFLKRPRDFLPQMARRKPVPIRICVIGPKLSGKTDVSKALARNWGVCYVNFAELLLKTYTNPINDDNINTIENYLKFNTSLDRELLGPILHKLWFEPPYKNVGFILDDFPQQSSDLEEMLKMRTIPDMILHLKMNQEIVIGRQLNVEMGKWHQQITEQLEIQQMLFDETLKQWELEKQHRFKILIEEKRDKLRSEFEQELDEETLRNLEEEAEYLAAEELVNFDESQPVLEHNNFETESEALYRFTTSFETAYLQFINNTEVLRSGCKTDLIPWFEIDADLSREKTIFQAYSVTEKIGTRNESHLERCVEVSLEIAEDLLSKGYIFLSPFGRKCPVQCYEHQIPIFTYIFDQLHHLLQPIIHQHYVYFISGPESVKKFKLNPLKYIYHGTDEFVQILPYRLSVVGAPNCGKTHIAQRFQTVYGFPIISRGSALRFILDSLPNSQLAFDLELILRRGCTVPIPLVLEAVHCATFHPIAVNFGFIFDGFPNSIEECNLLTHYNLVPQIFFNLGTTDYTRYKHLMVVSHLCKNRMKFWNLNRKRFSNWYYEQYQNLDIIHEKLNLWSVWDECNDTTLRICNDINEYQRNYRSSIDYGLYVRNMLITPLEFLQRKSALLHYCPSCLYYSNVRRNAGSFLNRSGLIQYKWLIYWFCAQHLDAFMENPEKILNANIELPDDLAVVPIGRELDELPDDQIQKTCMVCFSKNSKPIHGTKLLAAKYRDKAFLFDSEFCQHTFLESTQNYVRININFEGTIKYPALDYKDLPPLGLLEQYVSAEIIKGLTNVNHVRPLVPGLTIQQSAAIHLGLYLKLCKGNSSVRVEQFRGVFQKAFELYERRRTIFLNTLDHMKSTMNPYLDYIEPERSTSLSMLNLIHKILEEFDYKNRPIRISMQSFINRAINNALDLAQVDDSTTLSDLSSQFDNDSDEDMFKWSVLSSSSSSTMSKVSQTSTQISMLNMLRNIIENLDLSGSSGHSSRLYCPPI